MNRFFALSALLLIPAAVFAEDRPDVLFADFEGENYGAWQATGEAFGPGPARGTLANQMHVSGFEGKGLVNTFFKGDATTGTLLSPEFPISRKFINFLIGGGNHPNELMLNLIIEGSVVRSATGDDNEMLSWANFDVAEFENKTARLQIIDKHKGGWGHLNVDSISFSDKKRDARADAKREIVIENRYLNFPVKTGAPRRRVSVNVDGKIVREFEIELADGAPSFWSFLDVSTWKGKTAAIVCKKLPADSKALETVSQNDTVKDADSLYQEKERQAIHFSSRRGWLNDPNGMVFYKGEYHLYYQHNPYGWAWGNMHWGHAVSPDLVHWTEEPIAIYPYKFGDWAFSGSAIVDAQNTAGFKTGNEDVIVAAYTSTGRGECIVYSNDRGRTFTEYESNPVVKHSGRDPKLIWYAPGKHWVMAVYDEFQGKQWIAFHSSADLKNWKFESRIDGYFECPEIFELPVDGDANNTRWIVYAADGNYSIGKFDGKTFTPESGKHRGNYGNCFYASQIFNNTPDGRRIQIGWGRIDTKGAAFNQCMLFPCELTLRKTDEGVRLFTNPVRELETLAGGLSSVFRAQYEFEVGNGTEFALNLGGIPVKYDVQKQTLTCKNTAPLKPVNGKVRLDILVDRNSIEIFGNDGQLYMPIGAPALEAKCTEAEPVIKGDGLRMTKIKVIPLKSTWHKK